jgi:hypothetical protein
VVIVPFAVHKCLSAIGSQASTFACILCDLQVLLKHLAYTNILWCFCHVFSSNLGPGPTHRSLSILTEFLNHCFILSVILFSSAELQGIK